MNENTDGGNDEFPRVLVHPYGDIRKNLGLCKLLSDWERSNLIEIVLVPKTKIILS